MKSAIDLAKNVVKTAKGGLREPPKTQFPKIAKAWSAYLQGKLKQDISAEDVGWMMVMFKAVRQSGKHDPDNLVDAHGYLVCIEELNKEEK